MVGRFKDAIINDICGERISDNIYLDGNGQLICSNCVLARTGSYDYRESELIDGGSDEKVVKVYRDESEVFDPVSMKSMNFKPLVNDHPDDNVTPDTVRDLQKGFMTNVRRGEGEFDGCLIGDLVVTDPEVIDLVLNKQKRDLSVGYTADIDEENGRYVMKNIRGNHIALCAAGRAGNARIRDSKTVSDSNYFASTGLSTSGGGFGSLLFLKTSASSKSEAEKKFANHLRGKSVGNKSPRAFESESAYGNYMGTTWGKGGKIEIADSTLADSEVILSRNGLVLGGKSDIESYEKRFGIKIQENDYKVVVTGGRDGIVDFIKYTVPKNSWESNIGHIRDSAAFADALDKNYRDLSKKYSAIDESGLSWSNEDSLSTVERVARSHSTNGRTLTIVENKTGKSVSTYSNGTKLGDAALMDFEAKGSFNTIEELRSYFPGAGVEFRGEEVIVRLPTGTKLLYVYLNGKLVFIRRVTDSIRDGVEVLGDSHKLRVGQRVEYFGLPSVIVRIKPDTETKEFLVSFSTNTQATRDHAYSDVCDMINMGKIKLLDSVVFDSDAGVFKFEPVDCDFEEDYSENFGDNFADNFRDVGANLKSFRVSVGGRKFDTRATSFADAVCKVREKIADAPKFSVVMTKPGGAKYYAVRSGGGVSWVLELSKATRFTSQTEAENFANRIQSESDDGVRIRAFVSDAKTLYKIKLFNGSEHFAYGNDAKEVEKHFNLNMKSPVWSVVKATEEEIRRGSGSGAGTVNDAMPKNFVMFRPSTGNYLQNGSSILSGQIYEGAGVRSAARFDKFPAEMLVKDLNNVMVKLGHKADWIIQEITPKDLGLSDELIQSGSKEALSKNIATEIKAGKDPKQAAAIAHSVQRKNDASEPTFKFAGKDIPKSPYEVDLYWMKFGGTGVLRYNLKTKSGQITTSHPYDETEYHWAKSTDGRRWDIIYKGSIVGSFYGDAEAVLKELVGRDKAKNLGRKGGIW